MSESTTGEIQCPKCGNSYTNIGNHWTRSSTCSHPAFSAAQLDILRGLLLTGASIPLPARASSNTVLRLSSTNKAFLDWVREQFPVLGTDVRLDTSAEDSAARLSHLLGEDADETEVDASDIYEWLTRSHPTFDRLRHRWYDDSADDADENTDPEQVVPELGDPGRRTMAVAFALRGHIKEDHPGGGRTALVPLDGVRGTADDWRRLLAPFDPVRRGDDYPQIWILDTRGFFEWLAEARDIPMPPPGCADWWPDLDDEAVVDSLATIEPDAARCPSCGSRFKALGQHWWYADDCDAPPLTNRQSDILTGLFLTGGTATHVHADRRSTLRFGTQSEAFARWLDDELGVLAQTVWEGTIPNASDDDSHHATYTVITRHAPAFDAFAKWYDDEGQKVVPEDDIDPSPTLLSMLYARSGRQNGTYRDTRPRVHLTPSPASDAFFERLFADFDPEIVRTRDLRLLYINDADAFFDYVGPAPDGHDSKWGVDA